jgi:hypothetical protein
MNIGLGLTPIAIMTVPYTPLGAAVLMLPTESVVFNFGVLSPNGKATTAT